MRNIQRRAISALLLDFTKLDEAGQSMFISSMNEFLLASSKRRKSFIEQWGQEYVQSEKDWGKYKKGYADD